MHPHHPFVTVWVAQQCSTWRLFEFIFCYEHRRKIHPQIEEFSTETHRANMDQWKRSYRDKCGQKHFGREAVKCWVSSYISRCRQGTAPQIHTADMSGWDILLSEVLFNYFALLILVIWVLSVFGNIWVLYAQCFASFIYSMVSWVLSWFWSHELLQRAWKVAIHLWWHSQSQSAIYACCFWINIIALMLLLFTAVDV